MASLTIFSSTSTVSSSSSSRTSRSLLSSLLSSGSLLKTTASNVVLSMVAVSLDPGVNWSDTTKSLNSSLTSWVNSLDSLNSLDRLTVNELEKSARRKPRRRPVLHVLVHPDGATTSAQLLAITFTKTSTMMVVMGTSMMVEFVSASTSNTVVAT